MLPFESDHHRRLITSRRTPRKDNDASLDRLHRRAGGRDHRWLRLGHLVAAGIEPDEDYHLASIWCPPPVESSGCKVQTAPDGKTAIVVNARVFSAPVCYAFHPEISGACVFGVPTTPGLDERFDRGEYPGGYYRVMHLFVVSDPYTTTYLIREVNVVLTALLGLLLVLAAAPPTRRLLAYAIASTYVPMGIFLVASINPSSWAVVGVTTTAFAFHSYWMAETRPRVLANAGLAAVGVAMSASARADAALFAALTALALLVLHLGAVRRHLVRLVLPAVAIVVAAVVYATSGQASTTLTGSGGQGETGSGWSAALFNAVNLPNLLLGNQGLWNLGWLDTTMPSIVYIPMIVVCAFMLMAGLSQLPLSKTVVAVGGILVLVGLPLYILYTSHLLVGQGLQSRYLLPLLPVLSLVILTGTRPDQTVRLPEPVAWLTWIMVSTANAFALMVNIQRYTTGLDGPMVPGRAIEWWSTGVVGPLATWILGTLGFAVAAWMVVRLSTGRDVPVAATGEQKAIGPAVVAADEPSLTPAGPVVDAEPTPVEAVGPDPVRPGTAPN